MRKLLVVLVVSVILVACSPAAPAAPSEAAIQTAIAQTAEAMPVDTAVPTETLEPTPEPEPTKTPRPTRTPAPTNTPWPVDNSQFSRFSYFEDEITGQAQLSREIGSVVIQPWISIAPSLDDFTFIFSGDYLGNDWLFIDSVIINADDEVYQLPLCYYDSEVLQQDLYGGLAGDVYETFSVCLTSEDEEMINQIIDGEKVMVRFAGKDGNYDRAVTTSVKQAFNYTYQLYNNLLENSVSIREDAETGDDWWE